jgi:hypothetical protein
MEYPMTAQDRDYYSEIYTERESKQDTRVEDKRTLMNLITELESDLRVLENKIEKIKSTIYNL